MSTDRCKQFEEDWHAVRSVSGSLHASPPSTSDKMTAKQNLQANYLTDVAQLGAAYIQQGEYEQAEKMLRPCLEEMRRSLGNEDTSTLGAIKDLAVALWKQGRYPEGEALAR